MIDCPPSLGLLTVNGLAAADDVIVPIQCEYYALEGLGQLLRNLTLVKTNLNPPLDLRGIVLTMYDARTKLAEQVEREVRAALRRRRCTAPSSPAPSGSRKRRRSGSRSRCSTPSSRGAPRVPRARQGGEPWRDPGGLGKGLGALIPTGGGAAGREPAGTADGGDPRQPATAA